MLFSSKVGVQTTHLVTQCLCNHLTFFGGSFFVTPNHVDPSSTAELFGTFAENPVVVCFVGALFVAYFLVVVWAWRKDIQNVSKVLYISSMGVLFKKKKKSWWFCNSSSKYVYCGCLAGEGDCAGGQWPNGWVPLPAKRQHWTSERRLHFLSGKCVVANVLQHMGVVNLVCFLSDEYLLLERMC